MEQGVLRSVLVLIDPIRWHPWREYAALCLLNRKRFSYVLRRHAGSVTALCRG